MKKFIAPLLAALLILTWLAAPASAQKDKEKGGTKVFIPKEIKEPMQAGLSARQANTGLPFEIFKTLYLPLKQVFNETFFLKIKNSDLGFVPAPAAAGDPAAPAKMRASFFVFLQFHKIENGVPAKILKEIYVPMTVDLDQTTYDPNKQEWYSVSYPFLPGEYVAAIALSTTDLKQFGIQYCDFKLPDFNSPGSALDTTPIFIMKDFKQVDAAESKTELHRGFFSYSILNITPNVDNVIAPGDTLDLFFAILGAQPKSGSAYDLEIVFEITQADKAVVKFGTTPYDGPMINQPLPMKQTLQIVKDKESRTETRDLGPGSYTLVAKIKDKTSGSACEKKFDFIIK